MAQEDKTLGLNRVTVALRGHCVEWAAHYASEIGLLRQLIGDDLITAEHVGSTTIPGIVAKPVIDIMIAVPTLDCADRHGGVLAAAGYERRANGDGPERRFFAKGPPELRTHHLSMTLSSSRYWHRTIEFRDFLLANVDIAKRYEALKLRLADLFPNDRPAYAEGKSEFIAEVLAFAADG